MLSSRYLHLHEALGLGVMWLKQGAYIVMPSENPSANRAENIADGITQTINMPSEKNSVIPESVQTASNPVLTPSIIPQSAPVLPHNDIRATVMANVGSSIGGFQKSKEQQQARLAKPTAKTNNHQISQTIKITPKRAKLAVISVCPALQDMTMGALFSGEAGELLDKMLRAIKLEPHDVHKTAWLKTPDATGNPSEEILEANLPALRQELTVVAPQAMIFLGNFFENSQYAPIMAKVYQDLPFLIIPHPARILRQPQLKAQAWEALKTWLGKFDAV